MEQRSSGIDMQNNEHVLFVNGNNFPTMHQNSDINRSAMSSPCSPTAAMLQISNHSDHNGQLQLGAPTISEVGSIIGKRGDHIKIIRDESNAKINISDGSCPERIVTITGNVDTINKAFTMICRKFEDDMQQLPNSVPKPPITFRLIVPATQCGSLIGKGGSKIKELREATGASIQVASEMLPASTERAVTISGTAESIITCMHQICQILLESPPKGATIPYRPKPTFNPLLLASSAAAAAAAQQPCSTAVLPQSPFCQIAPELTKIHPLNQLLPEFNPTVLAGHAFSTSGNVLSLPATAAYQSALFSPKLAMTAAAGHFGSGTVGKNGEAFTSYVTNSLGRLDSDVQQKAHNEAAAFSQYVVNGSPTRAAATAANSAGGVDVADQVSNPSSSMSQAAYHQLQPAMAGNGSSTAATVSLANPALAAAAAAMASMGSSLGCHQSQGNYDAQTRQQLNALHSAAAAAAFAGAAIRSNPQRKLQPHAAAIQPGLQIPFLQYSPTAGLSSTSESWQTTQASFAAAQQQAAFAWLNMLGASGCPTPIGLNSTLSSAPSPFTVMPFPNGPANASALMLPAGMAPATGAQPMLYPINQHHQLIALQQAAAAASIGGGGPMVGSVGEKLANRFTPY